jgi:hypothetical protein
LNALTPWLTGFLQQQSSSILQNNTAFYAYRRDMQPLDRRLFYVKTVEKVLLQSAGLKRKQFKRYAEIF